jgi:Rod binding domain-containing protein
MDIAPVQNRLDTVDIPPEQLAGNTQLTEAQKIGEVARQFEAILLRQILRETQTTVFTGSLTDDSTTAGIYQDMVTQQLADSISKSGSFGLAQALQSQLTRQLLPVASAGDGEAAPVSTGPDARAHGRPLISDTGGPTPVRVDSTPIRPLNIP